MLYDSSLFHAIVFRGYFRESRVEIVGDMYYQAETLGLVRLPRGFRLDNRVHDLRDAVRHCVHKLSVTFTS